MTWSTRASSFRCRASRASTSSTIRCAGWACGKCPVCRSAPRLAPPRTSCGSLLRALTPRSFHPLRGCWTLKPWTRVFLRKGRFDGMFFVDLPDTQERAQIWDIIIKRYGRPPTNYDTVVLTRACEQYTGAEIEAVFIDALHEAYSDGREPKATDILEAMTRCVPQAQLMDGEIAAKTDHGRHNPVGFPPWRVMDGRDPQHRDRLHGRPDAIAGQTPARPGGAPRDRRLPRAAGGASGACFVGGGRYVARHGGS